MGTRNLTVAYDSDGTLRLAQYCQWDGYPSGQGKTVLDFLRTTDLTQLDKDLKATKFADEAFIQKAWKKVGVKGDFANLEQSQKFRELYPALHRDTGAKVLNLLPATVQNQIEFAGDGLFCEWAYVIDLKANTLEVYKGFFTEALTTISRFADLDDGGEYRPVQMIASWPLNNLPTDEEFLNVDRDEDDAEDAA